MAIPGLRGTEHIGFTVPDLDQADDFFVRVIGCERIYSLGPFSDDEGDWMTRQLGVHPRTVMRKLNFYRCGNGSNFEVFHYDAIDGNTTQPLNSDVGGHHLAFYVDDFETAYEYLQAEASVEILGEPVYSSGASTGQRWVYFRSPWGMQFELVSFPDGKVYEKNAPTVLWHPSRPSE